jgi:hypothetical protein
LQGDLRRKHMQMCLAVVLSLAILSFIVNRALVAPLERLRLAMERFAGRSGAAMGRSDGPDGFGMPSDPIPGAFAEITEMGELAEAGCVAFSQAEAPIADTLVLLRALQYAATFGHRVWLRRRIRISAAPASSTTARSRPASACPGSRPRPRRSRWPPSSP